jgi:hypothetical protein
VLKALLLTFHNRESGLCNPGYGALQRITGLCRQSIATALRRLEACGIITVVRRLVRLQVAHDCPQLGAGRVVTVTRQDTNLYRIQAPVSAPRPLAAIARPFPRRGMLAQLAAGVVRRVESTLKAETHKPPQSIKFTYCRPAFDWRERARRDVAQRALRVRGGV